MRNLFHDVHTALCRRAAPRTPTVSFDPLAYGLSVIKPLFALSIIFAVAVAGFASPALAQAPSPAGLDTLPFKIGEAVVKPTPGSQRSYYVYATAPYATKMGGQKLEFIIHAVNGDSTPLQRETSYVTVNTGKTKTLDQLSRALATAFGQFAGGMPAPGQELLKIGDVKYGGELRLVVETPPDSLRFDFISATPTVRTPMHFTKADAAAFAGILEKAAP